MNRLKPKEVAGLRKEMLEKQKGLCALCGLEVTEDQATLDHDHDTGHVRGVLHRNCNQGEGRIKQWAGRQYCSPPKFLAAILHYWEQDYTDNPLHPNHLTGEEKEIKRLKRQMKRVKRESTRERYRNRIQTLKGVA